MLRNRYKCNLTAAPGSSGDFTIGGALTGFKTFGAADDVLTFDVLALDGAAWEIRSDCTYTHLTRTLTRGTLADSSSGSSVTLSEGTILAVILAANRPVLINTPNAGKLQAFDTVEPLRIGYSASVYMGATCTSAGAWTFQGAGSSPSVTFADPVTLTAGLNLGNSLVFAAGTTVTGSSLIIANNTTIHANNQTANQFGFVVGQSVEPTGASLSTYQAFRILPTLSGSVIPATVRALHLQASLTGTGTTNPDFFGAYVASPNDTSSSANWNDVTGYFCADITATLAGNAYSFRSGMQSGTGKWTIYATGDAPSGHLGKFRIGSYVAPVATLDVTGNAAITAASGDALRVTNTGTGNSLLIEDAANPDSTPFLIDAAGVAVLGYTANLPALASSNEWMQIHGTLVNPAFAATSWRNSNTGANLVLAHSRGTTVGTHAAVSGVDRLGDIRFAGSDGTSFVEGATIRAQIDGTASTGIVPGKLSFMTANASGTLTVAQTIDSEQTTTAVAVSTPIQYTGALKTLTEGSATGICDIAIASNAILGASIEYTIEANDGTDFQARKGRLTFAAVNKGGTIIVGTVTDTLESNPCSAGTLSSSATVVTGTGKVTVKLNATSSLTQTVLRVAHRTHVDGANTVTAL